MGNRTQQFCDECNITMPNENEGRKTWVSIYSQSFQRMNYECFIRTPSRLDFCSKECMLTYFGKMYDNPEDYFTD